MANPNADPLDDILGGSVPNEVTPTADQPPFPGIGVKGAPGAPAVPSMKPPAPIDPLDEIIGPPPGVSSPRPAPPNPMAVPNLGEIIGQHAGAFATALPRGFLSLPEGLINIENNIAKQSPDWLKPFITSPLGAATNYAQGKDIYTPIDATGAIDKAIGADKYAAKAPLGSIAGHIAGGALLPVGALGAGAKIANPLVRHMAQGAMAGGIFGGVDTASEQIKKNRLDYPEIAGNIALSGLAGMGLGAVLHGVSRFFKPGEAEHVAPNEPPAPPGNPDRTVQELRTAWNKMYPKALGPLDPNDLAPLPGMGPRTHTKAELRAAWKKMYPDAEPPELPPEDPDVTMKEDGWREERVFKAEPATPKQKAQLHSLAIQKVRWDIARGKLESAVSQIMEELRIMPPLRKTLSPSQWQELQGTVDRLGMEQKHSVPFVETALETHIDANYKFKSKTLPGKIAELKGVQANEKLQHNAYDRLREAAVPLVPHGKTLAVNVGKYTVNVTRKTNPKFLRETPTQKRKYAEYEAHRDKLMEDPQQIEEQLTPATLLAEIEKDVDLVRELKDQKVYEFLKRLVFQKGISRTDPVKPFIDMVRAAVAACKFFWQLGVRLDWRKEVANTLKAIRASAGKINPRFWQRLTWNQVTSDVLRELSPVFALKRDIYLAAREKAVFGGRELLPSERELIGKFNSPAQILGSPLLKGWTAAERQKEFNGRILDDAYERQLLAEINRLEKSGVKEGFDDAGRYLRMLKLDAEDFGHGFTEQSGTDWLTKTAGAVARHVIHGEFTSIFLGKNTSSYHIGEVLAANLTRDPDSLIQAARQLSTSAIAREYAAGLAGKGMGQKLIEADRFGLAKWADQFNLALKYALEHGVPHGKMVQKFISHELPERGKTALTAVAAANRVAKKLKYPGGALQFMHDYVATAKGGKIPKSREVLLGKAEVESLIDRNETIMHLPEGPIQERTGFQRHNLIKPWFPFLRSIVQQSRVLTRYMDDFNEALVKRDVRGAARAGGAVVALHLITAIMGGRYTLPPYIWDVVRGSLGDEKAEELEKALETMRQLNFMDRRWHHMSLREVPALEGGSNLMFDSAHDVSNIADIKDDPDGRKAARTVATVLAAFGIDNIGHTEGLQNLVLLYGHMMDGIKGNKTIKVYKEQNIVQRIQRKPAKKLAEENIKYDEMTGFFDWALGGESTEEIKVRDRADRLEQMLRH